MKRNYKTMAAAIIGACCLTGCAQQAQRGESTTSPTEAQATAEGSIPFTVAKTILSGTT